ncbi:hypothetical protein QMO14_32395 [Variovorax sp. CAN2819]|uniref:hypothetical protein n=1 Tax=Variovorax sp. CAN15 TaxID=3046727 RepID=UPI00264780C8|nr:hypothetical protein [Variovorax sp. CAN15]MDN6888280.1 hypothetical protein [Variovorax sp. CAN15]
MNKKILSAALGAALLAALSGCGPQQPEANLQNLTAAMNAYLAKKGDLCLGKTRWPIDVPRREAGTRARNALQMPVLERLGLVSASKATVKDDKDQEAGEIEVTRYALTEEGSKYFVEREPQGDFCAAHLTLDKVVGWEAPKGAKEPSEVVVTYTYRINAAPWTGNAEVQQVFPMVDRVVRGAGTMQLKQSFRRTDTGWVPAQI